MYEVQRGGQDGARSCSAEYLMKNRSSFYVSDACRVKLLAEFYSRAASEEM